MKQDGTLAPAMTHDEMLGVFGMSRSTLSRRTSADPSHPVVQLVRKAITFGNRKMYDPADVAEARRQVKERGYL